MTRGLLVLLPVALALPACGPPAGTPAPPPEEPPAGPQWFQDVTAEVGIDFRQHAGPTGSYLMPQVMGSGLAVIDVDNDGRPDLLFLNNAGPNSDAKHKLYRQGPDGKFRDASAGSGLDVAGYGMGAAVGDVDNDGYQDVYVSQYGGGRLFRNKGDGTFEDVTAAAGVDVPRWGASCSFLDYDRDGWLDLVVVTYVDYDPSNGCHRAGPAPDYCHPNQFPGTAARLFRNRGRGPDGRWLGYEDTTAKSGLGAKPSSGLGVVCADLDGDGWVDVLAANDSRANHLWVNRRDGTFEERAVPCGLAFNAAGAAQANMGVALADLDGDGRAEVFVTHLSDELPTLWRPFAPGRFADATAKSGLANPRWRGTGFGTVAADFDHDGRPDLAVVNGRVTRTHSHAPPGLPGDLPEFWHPYAERNQLFANAGDGTFTDVSAANPAFTLPPGVYRGLAWTDLDGDGAVDLVATQVEGPARVFKNVAPKKGRWLTVRAFDPARRRDAIGATVTVRAGQRTWLGFANPGQSYCTSGDARAFFGLGPVEAIDEVIVSWPDGGRESFPGGAPDRHLTLDRGRGRPVPP